MGKVSWREMSRGNKLLTLLGGVVQFALLGAALWDLRRRPAAKVKGPKRLWQAVVFVNYVGPLSYFLVGRKD